MCELGIKLCLHVAFACASQLLTLRQWKMLGMGLDPFSACAFVSPLTQYKT